MKKVIFCLIAIFCFFNLSFSQTSINDYGKIHNELVEIFLNSGKKINDYKTTDEFVDDFYKMALSVHPELKNDEIIKTIKSGLFVDLNKGSFDDHFKKELTKHLENKKISKTLYDGLIRIIDAHNYKESLQIISELESKNLSDSDKIALATYKSVTYSSNQLWSAKKKFPDHSDWVIIADGIGGLLFSWSGPGCVVGAAVYSLAVNNCKPRC